MPGGPAGRAGSSAGGAAAPGRLSVLLEELARAPGEDIHRAWQRRLQPGDVVGRFEILREIGRGGFGVVHEALDQQLGRSVAFKTLRPARTAHELSADWIRKEAEAVARLDHPAIVTLHEVGTCDSGPYLVEELLCGQTLEERLRGGPLPVREAVAVGLEIARGLAHAHGRGVLHRDLKPANVFLTEDGRVKLLDFGLAHLLGTRGVQGAGTPGYMAPEQLRGEAIDARADVFALGALLFEALTGKRPFEVREGRSAALDGEPPPVLPAGTAAPLAKLLERCVSRDPSKRPANGQAMVEELLALHRALDRPRQGDSRAPVGTLPASRALRLGVLLAGIAGAVAGAAYLAARGRSTIERAGAPIDSPARPSVAVLPFADLSPGKDQEHFGDGIAEEIINALTRVEGLQVVGRTSSFSFKGRSDDLREVGRKLGAGAVLEGSVRSAGSKVRITAQLVNAASGYHLWSETYDRELGDVLALEDEIAQAVVDALRVRLAGGPAPAPRARRAVAPQAYTAYLVGRQLLRRYNLSDFEGARKAFEEAIALDPDYAPAWAGLAEATFWSSDYLPKLADIRKGFDRALTAADRALALDPELAQGYATRGFLRAGARRDWAGALTDFERALRLNPGDAQVHRLYSHIVLRPLGRFPEAIEEARRATELDPLDANAWSTYAAAFFAAGQLERALEAYDRSLVIQPEQDYAPSRKAMLLLSLGRPAEALTWAERSTSPVTRSWAIAIAAHSVGRAGESQRALERLVSEHSEGAAYLVAWVFAKRGERDKAFEWLERAYEQHDSGLIFAKTDPMLWGLHGDPRFAAFVRKVGLPVP